MQLSSFATTSLVLDVFLLISDKAGCEEEEPDGDAQVPVGRRRGCIVAIGAYRGEWERYHSGDFAEKLRIAQPAAVDRFLSRALILNLAQRHEGVEISAEMHG